MYHICVKNCAIANSAYTELYRKFVLCKEKLNIETISYFKLQSKELSRQEQLFLKIQNIVGKYLQRSPVSIGQQVSCNFCIFRYFQNSHSSEQIAIILCVKEGYGRNLNFSVEYIEFVSELFAFVLRIFQQKSAEKGTQFLEIGGIGSDGQQYLSY